MCRGLATAHWLRAPVPTDGVSLCAPQVTTAFEPWREAVVWQSGYFGLMPLLGVAAILHRLPTVEEATAAKAKRA